MMKSDEMRVELESFVNTGITQGWQGWPLKSQLLCRQGEFRRPHRAAAETTNACCDLSGLTFYRHGRFGQMSGGRLGDFFRG